MSAFLEQTLNKLKTEQTADVEQIARYKSLMCALDQTVKERAEMIRLLELSAKPENRNMTITDAMNHR